MTRKEFHKRLLITSLLLGLVLPLANVPVTSSLNQTKKAAAAEPAVMTFAEGEGTGEEFKEESWMLASQRRQGKDATQTRSPSNDTFGIRKNPYSKKETPEKVIRLFDLIKPYSAPESAAEEDPDNSFTDYRSTRAMLKSTGSTKWQIAVFHKIYLFTPGRLRQHQTGRRERIRQRSRRRRPCLFHGRLHIRSGRFSVYVFRW